jgi:crotonobetainyl-CoA:carnitine CoA-transferase CaiB-like acyl-CoA transferase
MRSLEGLRVLDLSRLLPNAFCTTMLADHGAEVIVMEAPRFKDQDLFGELPMMRRNKRHMGLDLRTEEGKSVFFQLAEKADVVVEGFRPGVVKRLGVDFETVNAVNPRIIYCSLTGYGQSGPLKDRASHDLNYMAAAGMLDLARDPEGVPIVPKFQMAFLAGSLFAVTGILLALAARERTGKGQYIDTAIADGLLSLLPLALSTTFSQPTRPNEDRNQSLQGMPCYRLYETGDGEYISVGPLETHLWAGLCKKLGCAQYADHQYDGALRKEIETHLEELFLSRDLKGWLELLNEPDDCVAPVTRVKDIPEDPQFQARGMIRTIAGGIPELGIAPKLSMTPGKFVRPAYRFGQHTSEILEELGYSQDRIKDLEAIGAVWSDNT